MGTRISGTSRITGTLTASVSRGDRVRSHQSGRTCGCSACNTILSVYNPSTYCALHASLAVARRRSIPGPATEVACARCGDSFETSNPARKYCSDRCRMADFARRKRAAVRAESRVQPEQALQAVAPASDGREAVVSAA